MNTFDVCSNYYTHNNIKYIISFPIIWLENEETLSSGPIHCQNCKKYGMFDDIFYFYCKNCLDNTYSGSRGNSEILNMNNIEKIAPDIFEQFVNFYYDNFENFSIENCSLIKCYGCSDELSFNETLLEQQEQFNVIENKTIQILCHECRNYPDNESWPPLGS